MADDSFISADIAQPLANDPSQIAPADRFFRTMDTNSTGKFPGGRGNASNLSQANGASGVNSAHAAAVHHRPPITKRHSAAAFTKRGSYQGEDTIPAVLSPATSADVAAKREVTRFPSIMFASETGLEKAAKQLPPPKSAALRDVFTLPPQQRSLGIDPHEGEAQPLTGAPMLTASETETPDKGNLSASFSNDLAALKSAVAALKSAPLISAAAKEPADAANKAETKQRQIPAKQSTLPTASSHAMAPGSTILHQRRDDTVANDFGARPAPFPAAGSGSVKQRETPRIRKLPPTPAPPANTPASPLLASAIDAGKEDDVGHGLVPSRLDMETAVVGWPNTQRRPDSHVPADVSRNNNTVSDSEEQNQRHQAHRLLGSQPPASTAAAAASLGVAADTTALEVTTKAPPSSAVAPSPARTEYDGEDVVMGDATPCAPASTVSRQNSRFRLEALRLGDVRLKDEVTLKSRSPSPIEPHPIVQDFHAAGGIRHVGVPNDDDAETVALEHSPEPTVALNASWLPAATGTPAAVVSDNPMAESEEHQARRQNTYYLTPSTSVTASSTSGVSNNPLYASTPNHPTPSSVTMMRPMGRHSDATTMPTAINAKTPSTDGSASSQGSSAAKTGIKLAEELHAAAERLQSPIECFDGGEHTISTTPSNNNANKEQTNSPPIDKKTFAVGSDGVTTGHTQRQGIDDGDDQTFQFKDDVAALLQALDASTPASVQANRNKLRAADDSVIATRSLGGESTEERRPRRRSSLASGYSPAILDLSKFDENGERAVYKAGTPLWSIRGGRAPTDARPSGSLAGSALASRRDAGITPDKMANITNVESEEVRSLRALVAELQTERDEATKLLEEYKETIAALQDRHSVSIIKLQAEAAKMRDETRGLKAEKERVEADFDALYREKYLPLKAQAAALRHDGEGLRAKLSKAEEDAKRADIAETQLKMAQESAEVAKRALAVARDAERAAEQRAGMAAATAKESENRLKAQFEAENQRMAQAVAAKDKEVSSLREQHAATAQQLDEALHRVQVAAAGKARLTNEIARKEDEICSLQVKYDECERALARYKAENAKFTAVRRALDARIRALTEDNMKLSTFVDELICKEEAKHEEKERLKEGRGM